MTKYMLYSDHEEELKYIREILQKSDSDVQLDNMSDYDDFINLYEYDKYDTIFVNFFDEVARRIVNHIQVHNRKQKVILITDSIKCIDNCYICKSLYKIMKFVKPLNSKDLISMLKDDMCVYDFYNKPTVSKLMCIIKKYKNFTFEENNFQIQYKNSIDYYKHIVVLTDELSVNNINYKVYEDYIQILKSE